MVAYPISKPPRGLLLQNGDHMNRFEFHRRYEESDIERAELIEGVVYVTSPLRMRQHGAPENMLGTWLGVFRAAHPGVRVAHNSTVFLDIDNEPQPDIMLWRQSGQAVETADGYLRGAPELVVEISASSASMDLHEKSNAYRRNGVKEYIVWRVLDGALDWFVLVEGAYVPLAPGADGIFESREFPGLRLDVTRLLEGDLAAVR